MFKASSVLPSRAVRDYNGSTLGESLESFPSLGDAARRTRFFNFTKHSAGAGRATARSMDSGFASSPRHFRAYPNRDISRISARTSLSPRANEMNSDDRRGTVFDEDEFKRYNKLLFTTHMGAIVSGMFEWQLIRKPVRDGLLGLLHAADDADAIAALGAVYGAYMSNENTQEFVQSVLKIYYTYA